MLGIELDVGLGANSDLVQCSKMGYSITAAAAKSGVGSTVRRSAFAVLRLMARSWSAEQLVL